MSYRPGLDPERLDPPVYHRADDRDRPPYEHEKPCISDMGPPPDEDEDDPETW